MRCGFDGSFLGLSGEMLELGEHLLDRVEVRRVWRQEDELGADAADGAPHGKTFVATEIVHDDDVARCEGRQEELLNIGGEALAVDRSVEDKGRIDPVAAQGCKEGQRAPFAERCLRQQPASTRRPSPDRRHVGLHPGFIDEDQASGIKPTLIFLPLRSSPGDPRTILLAGEQRFF